MLLIIAGGILLLVAMIFFAVRAENKEGPKRLARLDDLVKQFSPSTVVAVGSHGSWIDYTSIQEQIDDCILENSNGKRLRVDWHNELPVVGDIWTLKHNGSYVSLDNCVKLKAFEL